jgi:hypothetical protein
MGKDVEGNRLKKFAQTTTNVSVRVQSTIIILCCYMDYGWIHCDKKVELLFSDSIDIGFRGSSSVPASFFPQKVVSNASSIVVGS